MSLIKRKIFPTRDRRVIREECKNIGRFLTDYDVNRGSKGEFFSKLPVTKLRNLIIRRMRCEDEDENIRLPFQALLGKLHRGWENLRKLGAADR